MDADKDVLQTTKGRLWMLYVRKGMTKVSGVMCTWERSCKLELAAVYINNCVSSQSSFLFWLFTLLSISLGRERERERDRQTDRLQKKFQPTANQLMSKMLQVQHHGQRRLI